MLIVCGRRNAKEAKKEEMSRKAEVCRIFGEWVEEIWEKKESRKGKEEKGKEIVEQKGKKTCQLDGLAAVGRR